MSAPSPPVACFDFDGTLTRRDSLLPFLCRLHGPADCLWRMATQLPTLSAYGMGRLTNHAAKQRLISRFVSGIQQGDLVAIATNFSLNAIPQLLHPDVHSLLDWHLERGHQCVLVSASPAIYLEPWAHANGFSAVLATELEVDSLGTITGGFLTRNCHGVEKVNRINQWLAGRTPQATYAYGNSSGDTEMLINADFAYYRRGPNLTPWTPPRQ